MKKQHFTLLVVLFFVIASCSKETAEPVTNNEVQQEQALKKGNSGNNFTVHMTGSQEVPANSSNAVGQSIFRLRNNGTELHYKLIAANIQNITACHIHLAPVGVNGPVVVWLYPSGPPASLIPGPFNGVLAKGVITSSNLVGPLVNMTLTDLMNHINNGNAYVNLHTSQFPGGEVRGQF